MLHLALVLVLLLYHHGCGVSCQERPYFVSRNFRNVLQWAEESGGGDVLYSVFWARYGTEFEPKLECQNMTSLSCDLSTETAYDYHTSRFLARVYADAKLLGETQTFKPLEDTVLGPPLLSVRELRGSVEVRCSLPPGVVEVLTTNTFSYPHHAAYYSLNITTGNADVQKTSNGVFKVQRAGVSKACGAVVYRPHLNQQRSPSQEAPFCINAPPTDDPWHLFPWLLSFACLLVGCVPIVTVLACHYVRQKRDLPDCTKVISNEGPVHLLQPQKVVLSLAHAEGPCLGGTEGARKPPFTRPQVSRDSGCYSPQDAPSTPPLWQGGPLSPQDAPSTPPLWQGGALSPQDAPSTPPLWQGGPLSPQDAPSTPPLWKGGALSLQTPPPEDSNNSLHSSTIYSMVGVQPAREGGPSPLGLKENHAQLWAPPTGEPPFQIPLEPPPSLGPRLPGLQPDTQRATSVCLTPLSHIEGGFPMANLATAGEKAPLLSDLLCVRDSDWLDPEETRVYVSNQVPQHGPPLCLPHLMPPSGEPSSGYKQSWFPGMVVERQHLPGMVVERQHLATQPPLWVLLLRGRYEPGQRHRGETRQRIRLIVS
ncbi:uncharacterized protein LOC124475354 [Hypomesus transpacificus]|uniref:uncharacterized protein LOC124475354 n=1 Tax=Hypomesus transpacificus TaxID=137520 RepID=UPI001F07D12A|nr:uncharacterized protein LOC124475354 [Hypomesus transpacificus]